MLTQHSAASLSRESAKWQTDGHTDRTVFIPSIADAGGKNLPLASRLLYSVDWILSEVKLDNWIRGRPNIIYPIIPRIKSLLSLKRSKQESPNKQTHTHMDVHYQVHYITASLQSIITPHSTKEIIEMMWSCHLKRHALGIPHIYIGAIVLFPCAFSTLYFIFYISILWKMFCMQSSSLLPIVVS